MLWIFVAVFVVSTGLNTCAENLTAIVWQSDVNTLGLLSKAFEDSEFVIFCSKYFFCFMRKVEEKFI